MKKFKITTRLLKEKLKQWKPYFTGLPGVTIVPKKFTGEEVGNWALTWVLDNGQALIEVSVEVPEQELDMVILHELIHCVEIAQTGAPDPDHGTSFQLSRARILRDTGIDVESYAT